MLKVCDLLLHSNIYAEAAHNLLAHATREVATLQLHEIMAEVDNTVSVIAHSVYKRAT